MVKDMTKGNPVKLILSFSIPIFLGNIFQQLYSLVDTLIVGRTISVDALAAVGATGAISFLFISFIAGITMGFTVITGQQFGSGDEKGVRKSVVSNIILCSVLTVILTAIGLAMIKPLLKIMNTPDDILEMSSLYLVVIVWGTGATIFYNMVSNIIRALGDSFIPLIFLIISSVLNIFLDWLLIVPFGMGIAGAALATVLSQIISVLLCIVYVAIKFPILRLRKEDWKISGYFLWQHLRLGFPMGLQMSVMSIGIAIVQAVLNGFGTATIAAYTAASKIDQLAVQLGISIGVTASAYAAQNFGARKFGRIRDGIGKCLKIGLIVSILSGIFVVTAGYFMVKLFIEGNEPEILRLARLYLYIVAPFYYGVTVLAILRSALQGMGNALIPFLACICELVMRILAAIWMADAIGYAGVCFSSPAAWIGAALLLIAGYTLFMRKLPKEDEVTPAKE